MIEKEKLKKLPRKKGVYILKGKAGNVLYVGKAVNLRRRVASYFGEGRISQPLASAIAPKAQNVECIITDTEKEAILLENNLIKEHRPRYNVDLKDDKTYVHIRLSVNDEYPRLTIVRRPKKDGALFFGPYSSAEAARKTARFLQKLFTLRDCGMTEFASRKRPCIKHQIDRCSAPCCGRIKRGDYRKLVRRASLFLRGKTDNLLKLLEKEMGEAARNLNYEKARKVRDTIAAIRCTLERQKSVISDEVDRDVIGVYVEGEKGEVSILCVRGGKLSGSKTVSVRGVVEDMPIFIRKFLIGHYLGGTFIPTEILLPAASENCGPVESLLAEERGAPVRLVSPRRGDKKKLVEMASSNAEASFRLRMGWELDIAKLIEDMQGRFKLIKKPRTVECVDISDTSGREAVGSIVAFRGGIADKGAYRRFLIKSVRGANDCGMIYEVLQRRLRRGLREGKLPDLIMVDGGKGQLQAALRVLKELEVKRVAVIAIAKAASGRSKPDRIFLQGRRNAVPLRSGDKISLFLQQIRDEAHRFALSYHRKIRKGRLLGSELGQLKGVGRKRSATLLREWGSVDAIATASLKDLKRVLRDGRVAETVYRHFHR